MWLFSIPIWPIEFFGPRDGFFNYFMTDIKKKGCPKLGQPLGVLINYVKLFAVKDQFPGGGGSF